MSLSQHIKQVVPQRIKRTVRRILGLPNTNGAFLDFERAIRPESITLRKDILKWVSTNEHDFDDFEQAEQFEASSSPIVKQSYALTQEVRNQFRDKFSGNNDLRILIQLPPPSVSPGGYSLFSNLIDSLQFIGINTKSLDWHEPTAGALKDFEPSILLTSDDATYLNQIDWNEVGNFRKSHQLRIGLTASIQEYGNTPLNERLEWARKNSIDFYYSFRSKEYVEAREEYKPFYEHQYEIINIEFGANPLIYYSVPSVERDIDFSFLASINPVKWKRYFEYLKPVFSNHVGFIDGPGWSFATDFKFKPKRDRYIYARTKVGLNLHLDEQINWACELNERTYMLAACGVPQLIDNPRILHSRFSKESLFIAETPRDYEDLFMYMLENPAEAERRALRAQREVLASHTTFHRAETLVNALLRQGNSGVRA